jgi:hypothetical protein
MAGRTFRRRTPKRNAQACLHVVGVGANGGLASSRMHLDFGRTVALGGVGWRGVAVKPLALRRHMGASAARDTGMSRDVHESHYMTFSSSCHIRHSAPPYKLLVPRSYCLGCSGSHGYRLCCRTAAAERVAF